MSARYDAVVIGGDVDGLVAAGFLAKARLRVLLVERAAAFGDAAGALRALDPRVVKDLKLARHGLTFVARDLALTAPRAGGKALVLGRDRHATANAIAALSPADAAAFGEFHAEIYALARAMRLTWWDGRPASETQAALKADQRALLARLAVTSASALLSQLFESDGLKAALAFDAAQCGFAPSEAGSALALVWTAAQEMCGLQGAVASARGLTPALVAAAQAAGAELRCGATVSRLIVAGDSVAGIELASGEQIDAPLVLSSPSRRRTLEDLSPTALVGLGAAREIGRRAAELGAATLVLGLNRPPGGILARAGSRFVIADRLEVYETAHTAARLGRMPLEPALEMILPPLEPSAGRVTLIVTIWPVPAVFDSDALARSAVAAIERHVPGFAASVASYDVAPPRGGAPASVERLLAGAEQRIATPICGLLLCGADAEPADAISGRAARQAANLALASHRKAAIA